MVKTILTGAGFVEGKTFKETRFLKPPQSTYAVYIDSFTRRGADGVNLIKEHTYTIEVYSYKADPTAFKGSVADVSMFLRVAVTGRMNSPDLYEVMQILGKSRVSARIENMISKL